MSIPYIPADRLTRMQALDRRAMPATCSIIHPAVPFIKPDGSEDPGTPTTTTGVPCRYMDNITSSNEQLIAMRLSGTASALLSVPVGTVISHVDTVLYGGFTYQVLGSNQGEAFATNIAVALRFVS